jgi:hypothetical protein
MRDHDVAGLTDAELDRARRELAASLALARPDSPIRVPILSHMNAIDTELTCRGDRMCGCGLATDNAAMLEGHLFEYPGHEERDLGRYQVAGRVDLLTGPDNWGTETDSDGNRIVWARLDLPPGQGGHR